MSGKERVLVDGDYIESKEKGYLLRMGFGPYLDVPPKPGTVKFCGHVQDEAVSADSGDIWVQLQIDNKWIQVPESVTERIYDEDDMYDEEKMNFFVFRQNSHLLFEVKGVLISGDHLPVMYPDAGKTARTRRTDNRKPLYRSEGFLAPWEPAPLCVVDEQVEEKAEILPVDGEKSEDSEFESMSISDSEDSDYSPAATKTQKRKSVSIFQVYY